VKRYRYLIQQTYVVDGVVNAPDEKEARHEALHDQDSWPQYDLNEVLLVDLYEVFDE
jgi:hypothetical protein